MFNFKFSLKNGQTNSEKLSLLICLKSHEASNSNLQVRVRHQIIILGSHRLIKRQWSHTLHRGLCDKIVFLFVYFWTGEQINDRKPMHRGDFTRKLPRVVSLYIYSFLDPRSLCRASQVRAHTTWTQPQNQNRWLVKPLKNHIKHKIIVQCIDARCIISVRGFQVCWYWKYLCELDQLWMPKCMRLGWVLSFSPSVYERGVWKRLYLENIMALKVMAPRKVCVTHHHSVVELGTAARCNYMTLCVTTYYCCRSV